MLLKSWRILAVMLSGSGEDPGFSFSFTSLAVNRILSTELALKSGTTSGTLMVSSLVNTEPKIVIDAIPALSVIVLFPDFKGPTNLGFGFNFQIVVK